MSGCVSKTCMPSSFPPSCSHLQTSMTRITANTLCLQTCTHPESIHMASPTFHQNEAPLAPLSPSFQEGLQPQLLQSADGIELATAVSTFMAAALQVCCPPSQYLPTYPIHTPNHGPLGPPLQSSLPPGMLLPFTMLTFPLHTPIHGSPFSPPLLQVCLPPSNPSQ